MIICVQLKPIKPLLLAMNPCGRLSHTSIEAHMQGRLGGQSCASAQLVSLPPACAELANNCNQKCHPMSSGKGLIPILMAVQFVVRVHAAAATSYALGSVY